MNGVFDVYYADGRTSLVLQADLDLGWRRLQKTYGFFQQRKVPYRNDLTIRAQLAIICQPGSFDESARNFPDVEIKVGNENVHYDLHNKRLSMKVPLSPSHNWRTTVQGRPEIFIEEL